MKLVFVSQKGNRQNHGITEELLDQAWNLRHLSERAGREHSDVSALKSTKESKRGR